jgi:hypothetical protein
VFLEGERAAVRELGFRESDSWFHGAWSLRCRKECIRRGASCPQNLQLQRRQAPKKN